MTINILTIRGVRVLRVGFVSKVKYWSLLRILVFDRDIKNLATVQVGPLWIELNYGEA